MNWTHFLLLVAGLYVLYYLVNILIDVAAVGKTAATNSLTNELTFSEPVQAMQLHHEQVAEHKAMPSAAAAKPEPEVIASGGVPINDIFSLARQESIIYTRAVSF
jgi:hypothetical protein